ncbi:MAG TPA: peptide ABC transporter substrate-binding protein [Stellaceae bacterium]|nr:peptide ABC transporter substrate-binding protein [Stellaceae bacterium]
MFRRALALLPIAVAVLTGARDPAAATEQILRRPTESTHDTLDPQKTSSGESIAIDRDLFTGLLALDNHRRLIPGVAESWDISLDGKVWTFHLRPALKWSNGDPLTAADFVYTFRRLVDPRTHAFNPADLDQIDNAAEIESGKEKDLTKLGVAAVDATTLRVSLVEPRAAFRFLLADSQLFPLHQATVDRWGDEWTKPEHIVSNGPYLMKSMVPGTEYVLVRNPNFYDSAAVRIGEVHWINATDHDAAIQRFRAGQLDFIDVTVSDLPWVRQTMPDQLHSALADEVYFLFFNMAKGPVAKDARVRQAINLAIDRDTLIEQVDPHGEKPAYGLESPLVGNYTPQSMSFHDTPMAERLDKARALLKDAGVGPDKPLRLTVTYASGQTTRDMLLAIAAMLHPLGVELVPQRMDWPEFTRRKNERALEVGWMAELAEYDDVETLLQDFWSGSGYFNFTGYSNPKYDAVFRHVMTEMDGVKRRSFAEEAERTMLADYPFVPIYFNVRNRVVSSRLQNFPDEVHFPQSRYLSFKDPSP